MNPLLSPVQVCFKCLLLNSVHWLYFSNHNESPFESSGWVGCVDGCPQLLHWGPTFPAMQWWQLMTTGGRVRALFGPNKNLVCGHTSITSARSLARPPRGLRWPPTSPWVTNMEDYLYAWKDRLICTLSLYMNTWICLRFSKTTSSSGQTECVQVHWKPVFKNWIRYDLL